MSQRKQQVPACGVSALFQADALKLTEKHGVTDRWVSFSQPPGFGRKWIPSGALSLLILAAVTPREVNDKDGVLSSATFAAMYRSDPDFVLDFLKTIRHEWRKLGNSKRGRIQQSLSTKANYKSGDVREETNQWALADCQLAGVLGVEVADVEKARKALRLRILKGERLAAQLAKRTRHISKKVSV